MPRQKPLVEFPPNVDFVSQYGSSLLADCIETVWKARGYLGIRTQRYLIPGTKGAYGVRSNIGPNGYPPRRVSDATVAWGRSAPATA